MEIEAILFSSHGCGICQVIQPKLAEIFSKHPEVKYSIIKVDDDRAAASQNGVFMVPVLILKADGREAFRLIKSFSMYEVEEKLAKLLPQ